MAAYISAAPETTSSPLKTARSPHISSHDSNSGASILNPESREGVAQSGNLAQTLEYYPFGAIRTNERTTTLDEKRKFIGEMYDAETELSYLNARYYDSARGQFLSQDPAYWQLPIDILTDPQQLNSYSYARNNPISFKDADGKRVEMIAKAIEANSLGTHVFLLMTPDNPGDFGSSEGARWTIGGYTMGDGNLIKYKNDHGDLSVVDTGVC